MAEIEEWLAEASRELSIPIRKLPTEDAARIYRQAQARYVTGDPRVWWLALKQPCVQSDSSTTSLTEVLPTAVGLKCKHGNEGKTLKIAYERLP
jgi:hypothetical protein